MYSLSSTGNKELSSVLILLTLLKLLCHIFLDFITSITVQHFPILRPLLQLIRVQCTYARFLQSVYTNYTNLHTAQLFIYYRFLHGSIWRDLINFATEKLTANQQCKNSYVLHIFLWPQQVHIKRQLTVLYLLYSGMISTEWLSIKFNIDWTVWLLAI